MPFDPAAVVTNTAEIVDYVRAQGSIDAETANVLRRQVFGDGVVSRAEAELMFRLNDACRGNDAAWNAFFVDSLTDYFVWQQDPAGYLSDADAAFLIEGVTRDGAIDGPTELELLVNIVHWSQGCPESVILLTLETVRDSVLHGGGVLFGPKRRRKGVIDRADVAILSRVIYAGGGGGSVTITRREADLLFDLNDVTVEKENDPAWTELFVNAIANHLMARRGAPAIADADEARRREAWLADRRGVGDILTGMGRAVASLDAAAIWAAADLTGRRARAAEEAREAAEAAAGDRRERVDADEVAWLVGRISDDGILHASERALLAFIKANAADPDPSLVSLFNRAGV